MKEQKLIPIFFSCDDRYIPWLSVAMKSLIANASKDYDYKIHILNNGLTDDNISKIKSMETGNVAVEFDDVTAKIMPIIKNLGLRDYYTVAIYFRLFIASMFPEYKKAIYLDGDIVVLGDIAKMFEIELSGNILGVVNDQVVEVTEPFFDYVRHAVCVEHDKYFNSGVLLMDLEKFRSEQIEKQFVDILTKYNFELVAPDQDFLNFLCKDRVLYLDKSWNKQCVKDNYKGELNIVHYNYFKKPWNDRTVKYRKYFWKYCKETPFYEYALDFLKNTKLSTKQEAKRGAIENIKRANRIVASKNNFYSIFEEPFVEKVETITFENQHDLVDTILVENLAN